MGRREDSSALKQPLMEGPNHGSGERGNGHANIDLWNTLFRESTRTGDEAGAGSGSRVWMHIDDKGMASEVEVGGEWKGRGFRAAFPGPGRPGLIRRNTGWCRAAFASNGFLPLWMHAGTNSCAMAGRGLGLCGAAGAWLPASRRGSPVPCRKPAPASLQAYSSSEPAHGLQVDKHLLVYQLGIRYRDLLTLDPTLPLPFPAALFIRERAIVVNLETVRMIICSNQCYVLSVPNVRFAGRGRRRREAGPGLCIPCCCRSLSQTSQPPPPPAPMPCRTRTPFLLHGQLTSPSSSTSCARCCPHRCLEQGATRASRKWSCTCARAGAPSGCDCLGCLLRPPRPQQDPADDLVPSTQACRLSATYAQSMPYELRALEVALATVTATLETEVYHLEHDAYPVINKLLSNVRAGPGTSLAHLDGCSLALTDWDPAALQGGEGEIVWVSHFGTTGFCPSCPALG